MLYLPLMILCNRYSIGVIMTKSTRGGKRAGAGRPATGVSDTKVVRIDTALAPVVSAIKEHYSNNGTLDYIDVFRNIVTGNQTEITCAQERAEANLELMEGLHSRTLVEQKKLKQSLKLANREIEQLKSVTTIQKGSNHLVIECDSLRENLKEITELNTTLKAEIKRLQMDNDRLHVSNGKAKTELLTPKSLYKYAFTGGVAEIYAEGDSYHRREKLTDKKRFTKWAESFGIEINCTDGELYISTASGEHLLELTGKHK